MLRHRLTRVLLTPAELSAQKDDAGRLIELTPKTSDSVGVRFSGIVREGTVHSISFGAQTGPEKRRFPLGRRGNNGLGGAGRWNRKPDGKYVVLEHINPATPLYGRRTSSGQKNWPKRLHRHVLCRHHGTENAARRKAGNYVNRLYQIRRKLADNRSTINDSIPVQ